MDISFYSVYIQNKSHDKQIYEMIYIVGGDGSNRYTTN